MTVTIYVNWLSPPSRAVIMACHVAGIKPEYKFLDILNNEQNSPEFLKINPEHCAPTLLDGNFTLWESRPISIYLIDKHAPGHALFPKDLQKRALIHRLLDLDISVINPAVGSYVFPRASKGIESEPDEMEAAFKRLDETIFNKSRYAVGDSLTMADLFLIATCTFPEVVGYDVSAQKFPNLAAWMKRVKESDFYDKSNTKYESDKKAMMKK